MTIPITYVAENVTLCYGSPKPLCLEFEADSFAAFLYKRLHTVDKDLLSFIDFISTQKQTTPPGDERAELFRQILSKP